MQLQNIVNQYIKIHSGYKPFIFEKMTSNMFFQKKAEYEPYFKTYIEYQ